MTTAMMNLVTDPKAGWNLSISGARRAADRAKNAATVAYDWAYRAGVGIADAAEALAAAERAVDAADRASVATSREEIRTEAINAWSAAEAATAITSSPPTRRSDCAGSSRSRTPTMARSRAATATGRAGTTAASGTSAPTPSAARRSVR